MFACRSIQNFTATAARFPTLRSYVTARVLNFLYWSAGSRNPMATDFFDAGAAAFGMANLGCWKVRIYAQEIIFTTCLTNLTDRAHYPSQPDTSSAHGMEKDR